MIKGWITLEQNEEFYELLSVRMINRELWDLLKEDCKSQKSTTGREINKWLCDKYDVKKKISLRKRDIE